MIKNKIQDTILYEIDKDYLKQYKETLENCVYHEDFQKYLDTYIKDRNFSVFSLYYLLYKYLLPIHQLPKKEWYENIFKWAVSKSYPDKYNLKTNLIEEYLYKFYLTLINSIALEIEDIQETPFIQNYPICFLTPDEENELNSSHEYFNFKSKFKDLYIPNNASGYVNYRSQQFGSCYWCKLY